MDGARRLALRLNAFFAADRRRYFGCMVGVWIFAPRHEGLKRLWMQQPVVRKIQLGDQIPLDLLVQTLFAGKEGSSVDGQKYPI